MYLHLNLRCRCAPRRRTHGTDWLLARQLHACWSPDSAAVLTFADFGLFTTVWRLDDKATTSIEAAKLTPPTPSRPAAFAYAFSFEGTWLAVLSRQKSKVKRVARNTRRQCLGTLT